jgi:glucose-6-phosphate 1-dehydrogenase
MTPSQTVVRTPVGEPARDAARPAEPCTLIIFGASGDLTKRLLMPALFNLACDGLLDDRLGIIGIAWDKLTTDEFRARMSEDIRKFNTRTQFDARVWDNLAARLHYTPGDFGDPKSYQTLGELVARVAAERQTGGNLLFYFATPPKVFGLISGQLAQAGFTKRPQGWTRVIVEKPFGHDLPSAIELNRQLLAYWTEDQIYRIDHYLGKETVQNLLAFRFSNGIYEPLWNKNHIDHIQFGVAESVGVEGRGAYYEQSGVLRDMMQNHMFQMLAYLCMEPPASFKADAVRAEKAKVLDTVRLMSHDDVARLTVRGQYGPGKKPDGTAVPGYRQETGVNPQSATETFAAAKLFIDNWRWEGVPMYLRSGKALWKRSTEIVVRFKKAPEVIFRGTPAAGRMDSNTLIFHIQPDQGIELRFHAKTPGPSMHLQTVNMRFDYREAFEASRGTGYEVLLYSCMNGDATLFSRTDLVESAWRIAQPMLEVWGNTAPTDFPNYPAGSWGPRAAFDLIERDGRRWVEVINRDVLGKVPLFHGGDAVFLHNLSMMLRPMVYSPGDDIIKAGDIGNEMYVICRGLVDVLSPGGQLLTTLGEGAYFGELSLLSHQPRTATIRAKTPCNLFVLDGADFNRVLKTHPEFASCLEDTAKAYRAKQQV